MRHNYIAIEGNIGAGKSTLCHLLSNKWEALQMLEEFEDNPYLKEFYDQPDKYAFQLEMSFLAARYSQQRRVFQSLDLFRSQVISDYMLQKCFVFSSANLSEEEFSIYRSFFQIIENQFPGPELIVYLHRSVPILLDQIKKRGRDYESGINKSYLERIERAYFDVFRQLKSKKILVLDLKARDFENDSGVLNRIASLINMEHKPGIHRYKV